jgi:hypothetical protein
MLDHTKLCCLVKMRPFDDVNHLEINSRQSVSRDRNIKWLQA